MRKFNIVLGITTMLVGLSLFEYHLLLTSLLGALMILIGAYDLYKVIRKESKDVKNMFYR